MINCLFLFYDLINFILMASIEQFKNIDLEMLNPKTVNKLHIYGNKDINRIQNTNKNHWQDIRIRNDKMNSQVVVKPIDNKIYRTCQDAKYSNIDRLKQNATPTSPNHFINSKAEEFKHKGNYISPNKVKVNTADILKIFNTKSKEKINKMFNKHLEDN